MTTIVLADDHSILRQGLVQLLRSETRAEIVGEADNGDDLLELLRDQAPDLAIVDVSMPGADVERICQFIRSDHLETRLIVLTMHQSPELARRLLDSGASAYVIKKNAFDELQQAIEAVAAGSTFVSPLIASEVEVLSRGRARISLTARELQVVRLVATGLTNKGIAYELGISAKTAQAHRTRAMEKLQVNSSPELVSKAVSQGLIEL